MDSILKTTDLTKSYSKKVVVNKVNININKGDIYGFIGKNGAGKTTFMKMILGLAFPDSGQYDLFDGMDINEARRRTGSLIENPAIYKKCSARENLKRFSILLGKPECDIDGILKCVGLEDVNNKPAGKFSLGMKQRLGIAMAMVGNPDFMVLDEPINGLDPTGIKEIRDLILKLNREHNVTFLISSHLLDELSRIATKYGIIENGVLLEEVESVELENKLKKELIVSVDDTTKAKKVLSDAFSGVEILIEDNQLKLNSNIEDRAKISRILIENGVMVNELNLRSESLEDYFMERVGK